MTEVRVTDPKKTFIMPTKNLKLKMKTLRGYCNGAAGLTYSKNNDKYTVDINDDSLILEPTVKEYEVFYLEQVNKIPTSTNHEAFSERKKNIMALINKKLLGNFKTPQPSSKNKVQ